MKHYAILLVSVAFILLRVVLSVKLESLRDALVAGGWRTQAELNRMSLEDKRNTLIVEMHKHSNMGIGALQGFNNDKLIGMAAVTLFLLDQKYRTKSELTGMSFEDQRNTLIVELHNRLDKTIPKLQGKSNKDLVALGDAMVDKGRTIAKVISLTWDLDHAKHVGTVPEILAEQTYNNCHSTFPLEASFSYTKVVTKETTFETTDSINWKFGTSITFGASVPFVGKSEATVSFELGGEHTWSSGGSNSLSRKYTKTSTVNVPAGKAAQRKATMTIEKMEVPYTMRIINQLGSIRVVQGVWKGVTLMKSTDTQRNVPC